jgi:predicted RNA binding protein YcfA (HicA-like mRNA interferase family)
MSKLPRSLKPNKVIKALQQAGFEIDHITGGHYILRKGSLRTTVPYHKSVKTGTLRSILNQAGLSIDEFVDLLR